MAIVEEKINGRLGEYGVTIFEKGKTEPEIDAKLEDNVVIEFGKLERNPYRQIIKSYCTLSFVDEGLKLHERFRGGFSQEQYIVEINGPGVAWKGLLKEENRTVPLTNRIQKERTVLRFYGGIVEDRIKESLFPSPNSKNTYYLHDILDLLTIDTSGTINSEIFEDKLLRSSFEIETAADNWLDVTNKKSSGPGIEEAQVIDMWANKKLYDAVKNYFKLSGSVLYKALNSSSIVIDDSYQIGSSGTFKKAGLGSNSYSSLTRSNFIHEIEQDNIIIEGGSSGLEDLERVGDILVNFDVDDNIAGVGGSTNNNNSDIGYEQRITFGFSDLLYRGRQSDSSLVIDFTGSDIREIELGFINPSTEIGFVVEFLDDTSNVKFTLEYNNADADTASINNPNDGDKLIGPTTTQAMNPVLVCDASNPDFAELKVKYIDSQNRVIETLTASSDNSGVEEIEIDDELRNPPYIFSTFSPAQSKRVRNQDLNRTGERPFLFKAALERKYRPFGTQTLRGRFVGLYGPEYVHKITEDGSTSYWIPVGLKCNLSTGITDASLVEMPIHSLS